MNVFNLLSFSRKWENEIIIASPQYIQEPCGLFKPQSHYQNMCARVQEGMYAGSIWREPVLTRANRCTSVSNPCRPSHPRLNRCILFFQRRLDGQRPSNRCRNETCAYRCQRPAQGRGKPVHTFLSPGKPVQPCHDCSAQTVCTGYGKVWTGLAPVWGGYMHGFAHVYHGTLGFATVTYTLLRSIRRFAQVRFIQPPKNDKQREQVS
jgi:hypothetical protein